MTPTPQRRVRWALGWLAGAGFLIALVLVVQLSMGWTTLLEPWRAIPGGGLAVALLLVVASYGIRTIRVHLYFLPVTRGQFPRSFRLVLIHNLLNNLLPMRTGEASFPFLMKREYRIPFRRSVPALLFLRFLDLHFLLFLAAVVLLEEGGPLAWGTMTILAPIPLLAFYLGRGLAPSPGGPEGEGATSDAGAGGRMSRVLAAAAGSVPASANLFWTTWLWTVVNWAAKLLVFAWILRAFTAMPYSSALLGSVTGELSSVLPVHGLAGAGTYEAGILAGLLPRGIPLEAALRGAVNLHLFVLGASVLAGALALFIPTGRNAGSEGAGG
jgi:uncharacterized membrane protein YbhN (UPF0104 family)